MKFLARILICIAAGVLFSHQIITHHHQEDFHEAFHHHDDDHDDADHHDHFPQHQVAHIFSLERGATSLIKSPVVDLFFHPQTEVILFQPQQITPIKEYVQVRPPLLHFRKYFSLRAPPIV